MTVSLIPEIKFSTPTGKMATATETSLSEIAVVSLAGLLCNQTVNAFAKLHQGNKVPGHRSAAGGPNRKM